LILQHGDWAVPVPLVLAGANAKGVARGDLRASKELAMSKCMPSGRRAGNSASAAHPPFACNPQAGDARALAADLLQKAMIFHRSGQLPQAEAHYRQILQILPGHADALQLLGLIAYQVGKYEAAIELFDKALASNPQHAIAYNNRGNALRLLHRCEEAIQSFDQAIKLRPDYAEAYTNRGIAEYDIRQYEAAIASYNKAIQYKPNFAEAYNNRGNSLRELQQKTQALEDFEQAIRLNPNYADAYSNRGNLLQDRSRFQEALESYDKALALNANVAAIHSNRGAVLNELHQYEAAIESCDRAIQLDSKCVDAYVNRGIALNTMGRVQDAIECYDRALALNPNTAEAYSNRGVSLSEFHQYEAALDSCGKAIQLKPDKVESYVNYGTVLQATGSYQQALENYNHALNLKPDSSVLHFNRGMALISLKRYEEALESYSRALRSDPDFHYLYGEYLYTEQCLCQWDHFSIQCAELVARIQQDQKVILPFRFLALSDSAALQKKAAEIQSQDKWQADTNGIKSYRWPPHKRLRIGYFSPDFRDHPVSYLMAELFEQHDREQFEFFGFSWSKDANDAMRQRIAAAMEHFIDVQVLSSDAIVRLCHEHEIDIAVDLTGYTTHSRPGIFAQRAAPVQMNYLGYPGTMGADFMDYLVADGTLIPEVSRQYYTEKIVYMPDCFQVNDSRRQISTKPFTRAEQGLPQDGFVFCCFNNSYKVMPEMFARWMRILSRVEGSVLWLITDNAVAGENLRQEAQRQGVSAERLIFAGRLPLDEHLGRQRLADLFLDTFPFNAGATASPALWAGLPVLTCSGESFASRMAASLLHAVRLPELIAPSLDAYEEMAIELAQTPGKMQSVKERLSENLRTAPLFDTPRFTRHLEQAYRKMHERSRAGLAPDHIFVERLVE
jgi:predicted O-linked N-acetylglucosamine transferase (SPINDLY family)